MLFSGGAVIASAIAYERLSAARTHANAYPDSQANSLSNPEAADCHLLDKEVFYRYVASQMPPSVSVPKSSPYCSQWEQVTADIKAIQALAADVAQHEPSLSPDLIDALYTVVDLGSQFALALSTLSRVQLPKYQKIAQQQLETSRTRLSQTHHQLRSLHDQLLIEGLSQSSGATLSNRLQTLITDNKSGLLKD